MKDLDKRKVYYLGDMSDDQLEQLCKWLKSNDIGWSGYLINLIKSKTNKVIYYCNTGKDWKFDESKNKINTTNALELFEAETETIDPIGSLENIASEFELNPSPAWKDIINKELNNIFKTKYKSANVIIDEEGYKESSSKLNYELDFDFITQMAERMAQNKHKYEPYNWQKPIDVRLLKQSLFRHVLSVMGGEFKDDDRDYGHLESIALNAMFICWQLKNK